MTRLLRIAAPLAIVAAVGAIVAVLLKKPPEAEWIPEAAPPLATPQVSQPIGDAAGMAPRGGYYEGQVLAADDNQPISGARVVLVSYDAGDREEFERFATAATEAGGVPDYTLIPTIGDYEIAAELVADGEGRFKIAADRAKWVTHVLAYQLGYFFDVLATKPLHIETDGGRKGIVIRLQRAGRVVGAVVDDETSEPVPNALVEIYLQNKTRPPPDIPEGQKTGARSATGEPMELSQIAALGQFVAKELGERVWGIPFEAGESLRVRTDANGRFRLGPLGNTVQLEFVITHPEYKWMDFDSNEGKHVPRRTVVEPGELVEREFRLRRGGEITGRVIDRTSGKGVPDALVQVQSISQYYRHPYYAYKYRHGRTRKDGSFRVAGLSIGSQNVIVKHPSFGQVVKHGVEAEGKNLLIYADEYGALAGTITGLPGRPTGGRVTVHLEPQNSAQSYQRRKATVDKALRFHLSKLKPGRYRVWIRADRFASPPVEIEIGALETVTAAFPVDGGGGLSARFVDQDGVLVDPVTVQLVHMDGDSARGGLRYVSREGELDADGVMPGVYRLNLRASGYVPLQTEPFEIFDGRNTVVQVGAFQRYAQLALGPVLDERGRPFAATRGRVIIEVGSEEGGFRPVRQLTVPRALPPGRVTVRARAEGAGLSFERTIDLRGGETERVEIRLKE